MPVDGQTDHSEKDAADPDVLRKQTDGVFQIGIGREGIAEPDRLTRIESVKFHRALRTGRGFFDLGKPRLQFATDQIQVPLPLVHLFQLGAHHILHGAGVPATQERADIVQRHAQVAQIADRIERLELCSAVIAVAGRRVSEFRLHQIDLIVIAQRPDVQIEQLRDLSDFEILFHVLFTPLSSQTVREKRSLIQDSICGRCSPASNRMSGETLLLYTLYRIRCWWGVWPYLFRNSR